MGTPTSAGGGDSPKAIVPLETGRRHMNLWVRGNNLIVKPRDGVKRRRRRRRRDRVSARASRPAPERPHQLRRRHAGQADGRLQSAVRHVLRRRHRAVVGRTARRRHRRDRDHDDLGHRAHARDRRPQSARRDARHDPLAVPRRSGHAHGLSAPRSGSCSARDVASSCARHGRRFPRRRRCRRSSRRSSRARSPAWCSACCRPFAPRGSIRSPHSDTSSERTGLTARSPSGSSRVLVSASMATAGTDLVDLLAIAAHRDDASSPAAARSPRPATAGHRVGILDLTQGEMGTRGSAEIARRGSRARSKVLGVALRENLGLPDANIVNDTPTREKLARAIRRLRPRVVIAPALEGRHPDHIVVGAARARRVLPLGAGEVRARIREASAAQGPALPRVSAGFHPPDASSSTSPTSSSRSWRRFAATSRSSRARRRPARCTRTASRSRTSFAQSRGLLRSAHSPALRRAVFTTEMMRGGRRPFARGVDLLSDTTTTSPTGRTSRSTSCSRSSARAPRPSTPTSCCSSSCTRRVSSGSRRSFTISTD